MSLERFRKVYSILPEKEKTMVIVVVDDKEYTWEEAYRQIKENSELGKIIQRKLEGLDII